MQNRTTTKSVTSTKRILLDSTKFTIVKNTHDAIISKEDFLLTQELINSRKKISVKQNKNLYANILFCADCNSGMHYIKSRKEYVCGTYNKQGKKSCSRHVIKEDELSQLVLKDINILVNYLPPFIDFKNSCIEKELQKLNKQYFSAAQKIESLKTKRKTLTIKYLNESIQKDIYDELIEDLTNDIAKNQSLSLKYKNLLDNINKNELSKLLDDTISSTSFFDKVGVSIK